MQPGTNAKYTLGAGADAGTDADYGVAWLKLVKAAVERQAMQGSSHI